MDEQWLQPKHNEVSAEGKAPLAKTGTRSWFGRVSVDKVRKRLMMKT